MDWIAERKGLEILKAAPSQNSSLKKKLGIINKLKNILSEPYTQVLLDVKSENLHKFYTEIINSLLSITKVQSHEDIHKIVRIFYLYSYDPAFVAQLTSAIKRIYTSSWISGALFAETYFMINGRVDSICKALVKANKENTLHLIDYLVYSFEDADSALFEKRIREGIKDINEKDIDVLNSICRKIGWEVKLEAPGAYVEVVRPNASELAFYTGEPKAPEQGAAGCEVQSNEGSDPSARNDPAAESTAYNGESDRLSAKSSPAGDTASNRGFSIQDIKRIEENIKNTEFLDNIGREISGNPELVARVLKKKRNMALLPAIARIITRLTRGRADIIHQLLAQDLDSIAHTDLILIGELYKFGAVRPGDMIALLGQLFKGKMIEKLSILIENAGRFLLWRKETNKCTRDLLDRLRAMSLSDIDRLFVSDCLSKVFQADSLNVDIVNFFDWFFREKNFSSSGIFSVLKRSQRLLCIVFMQPIFFESDLFLARVILETGMEHTMLRLYLDSLVLLMQHSLQSTFRIIEVVGVLIGRRPTADQAQVLDLVMELGIPDAMKHRMLVSLLDHCHAQLHRKYIDIIVDSGIGSEMRAFLFNFCEKHGYDLQESSEMDSFEQEMDDLR